MMIGEEALFAMTASTKGFSWYFGKKVGRKAQRQRLWLGAIVAVVVVAGTVLTVAVVNQEVGAPKAAGPEALKGYGFATSFMGLKPAEVNQKMADLKTAGAGWVRFDLSWDVVQHRSANAYDWSATDVVVRSAAAHGLRPVVIVDFTPPWARPGGCKDSQMCGPAKPEAYGAFAGAAVRHYRPLGVEDWEIWNEPNISSRFRPVADPELYVRMLKAAYADIKAADVAATVVAASTAPAATEDSNMRPDDFLKAMYENGAAGSFDAISTHPYTYPNTPAQSNPADAWGQLQGMHNVMAAHGDGKKLIWITEYGAPTRSPNDADVHAAEATQVRAVNEAIRIFRTYEWSGPLLWYDYRDEGTNTGDVEDFYGLVRHDGTHKPAYEVFRQAVGAAGR
jgi:polysaccharide biosynthesis protein PslG